MLETGNYCVKFSITTHKFLVTEIFGCDTATFLSRLTRFLRRDLSVGAETVITSATDFKAEKQYITQALANCGYPSWTFNRVSKPKETSSKANQEFVRKGKVVLPYIKGISEALKRTFNSYGITVCFKPTQTLRQLLVAPKDKTEKKDITGPVYMNPCQGQTDQGPCTEVYIGETERSLKTRFLEHRRPSSTTSEVSQHIHIESPGHHVDLEKVQILDREPRYFERGVKEAIYIRVNQPSLNRDGGRYKLPKVYDPILMSRVRKVTTLRSVQSAHEVCSIATEKRKTIQMHLSQIPYIVRLYS